MDWIWIQSIHFTSAQHAVVFFPFLFVFFSSLASLFSPLSQNAVQVVQFLTPWAEINIPDYTTSPLPNVTHSQYTVTKPNIHWSQTITSTVYCSHLGKLLSSGVTLTQLNSCINIIKGWNAARQWWGCASIPQRNQPLSAQQCRTKRFHKPGAGSIFLLIRRCPGSQQVHHRTMTKYASTNSSSLLVVLVLVV